jgi:hypothetical protein
MQQYGSQDDWMSRTLLKHYLASVIQVRRGKWHLLLLLVASLVALNDWSFSSQALPSQCQTGEAEAGSAYAC